jgi:molecular chaperone GrpE
MKKTHSKKKHEKEARDDAGTKPAVKTPEDHESDEAGTKPAPGTVEELTAGAASDEAELSETAEVEQSDTMESLQAKVASLEDAALRAKADFQNFQKRGARERSEAIRFANAELMQSLLGVVDDFERSLVAAESSDNAKAVVDGVRLVYDNFMKALRAYGLETIDALHEPFDPHVHEAVMLQPTEDHEPGTVIEEIARGYRLRDRVLRPSKVIVAQATQKEQVEEEGDTAESTTATEGN